jgi:hypothetical protein
MHYMFRQATSVYHIQLFLRWLAKTRTGRLEENITDTTIQNRLSSLKRNIKLLTGRQYNSAENKDLEIFITKDLAQNGRIATGAYTKPVAPLPFGSCGHVTNINSHIHAHACSWHSLLYS